jgi:hypothetical protein
MLVTALETHIECDSKDKQPKAYRDSRLRASRQSDPDASLLQIRRSDCKLRKWNLDECISGVVTIQLQRTYSK